MTVAEKIMEQVADLPEPMQEAVLEFVESLRDGDGQAHGTRDDDDWRELSLAQAMRGMESEPWLYSETDLKEAFR
jgi:hypothetical protein